MMATVPQVTERGADCAPRIVQESRCSENVFRHSRAQKSWVEVEQRESEIIVRICDDGKGVTGQVSDLMQGQIGVGLGGMSQRAKEFGGELRVTNAHPGTIVEVVIPCCKSLAQQSVPAGGARG